MSSLILEIFWVIIRDSIKRIIIIIIIMLSKKYYYYYLYTTI